MPRSVPRVATTGANAGTHFEETANAPGKSKIDGIEADVTFYVTDALSIGASYASTKVEIPDAPFPFPAAPGNFLQPGDPFQWTSSTPRRMRPQRSSTTRRRSPA